MMTKSRRRPPNGVIASASVPSASSARPSDVSSKNHEAMSAIGNPIARTNSSTRPNCSGRPTSPDTTSATSITAQAEATYSTAMRSTLRRLSSVNSRTIPLTTAASLISIGRQKL